MENEEKKKRGFSLSRFALMLLAIALAHFLTAVGFGHSVADALWTLAEDAAMVLVVVAVAAYIRTRMRRREAGER
ncbi:MULTISPECIES: hypothetical protein [Streptomyces]|uniref:hypothetical protein n=1 Tax=Streptomyces TaxID=1883 RepID=UPI0029AE0C4F|nr:MULTISPECIES: hypothetical protein [unclassified Streptomyces]MDX2543254.1 hypothetical protein [Streptomyces sp. WI04-05B]MDX2584705.1 hypothetical protein [Streptomyces sp. WI04-05A]MDX3752788.1 hypothetical protein [Streptomyces sp. AK08-02]